MIRTGSEYLEGLRDGREIFVDGRRVEDVTTEPGFDALARTIAGMFDLQHDPEYARIFAFEDARAGVRSRCWFRPRSPAELRQRQQLTQTVARLTGGFFGRMPEYVPLFFLGLLDQKSAFSQGNRRYEQNIERYFEETADADRTVSHAFVDVQTDPNVDLDETQVPRIVNQTEDGMVVSGLKSVATFAPHADEVLIGTFPRPGLKDHHVMYFSIPIATPGLRLVARPPYGLGTEFDHPASRFGDENDSMIILDEVFVPWERVFQANVDASFAVRVFPLITEWAHWSILCRLAAKAEMMTGIFAALPEMLGRANRPDVVTALGEMERYLVTLRAFIDAAAARGTVTPGGHFMPDPGVVTAGRCYSVDHYPRLIQTLKDICGQAFMIVPSEGSFANEDIGDELKRAFPSPIGTALDRARLTRLAFDLAVDTYGGRQTLFEIFNATGLTTIRAQMMARFDTDPYKQIALATAGIGDMREAEAALRSSVDGDQVGDYDRVGDAYVGTYRHAGNAAQPATGTRRN